MRKIIKKILLLMMCFILVFMNITSESAVEVKASIAGGLGLGELTAIIIGAGASSGVAINNGGVVPRDQFDRAYNNIIDNIKRNVKIDADAIANLEAVKSSKIFMDVAYNTYVEQSAIEQKEPKWRYDPKLDLPIGGNSDNPTLRQLESELNDIALEDVELWQDTMRKYNPSEPPDNNSFDWVKKLLFWSGTAILIGSSAKIANDNGTYDLDTGKYYDAETGAEIDPRSGLPIDPDTGYLVMKNGHLLDPKTGNIYDAGTKQQLQYKDYCDSETKQGQVILKTVQNTSGYKYEITDIADINDTTANPVRECILKYTNSNGKTFMIYKYVKYSSNSSPMCVSFGAIRNVIRDGLQTEINTSINAMGGNMSNIESLTTNFPLFSNEQDAVSYCNGTKEIKDADNYKDNIYTPMTEEEQAQQQKLNKVHDNIQQLKEQLQDDDSINDDLYDQVMDEIAKIKNEVTEDTTPEEVADKVIDDMISPITTPIPTTDPVIDPTFTPTPTVEPNPTDPTEPTEGGKLGGVVADVFPFCIPFDLIYLIKALKADPKPPKWVIPIRYERLGINEEIVIDFAMFETIAEVCRTCFTILFILTLIMVSRKLIKG